MNKLFKKCKQRNKSLVYVVLCIFELYNIRNYKYRQLEKSILHININYIISFNNNSTFQATTIIYNQMHNKYVYQKAIQFNLELRNRYVPICILIRDFYFTENYNKINNYHSDIKQSKNLQWAKI